MSGRDRSVENLLRNAQQAKAQTTAKLESKASALESTFKKRLKNPMLGLPRSLSQFLAWKGEDGALEDISTSRSSLQDADRSELKARIHKLIESVKNPYIMRRIARDEVRSLAESYRIQLEGLAAANHHLEEELENLKAEINMLRVERDRLQKTIKTTSAKRSSSISRIS